MPSAAVVIAVVLTALAVVGAAAGIVVAFTRGGGGPSAAPDGEPGLVRVTAQVHTGWEQTLLGLHRELQLPRRPDGLAHGSLYAETMHERQLVLRSRSEIGRGFLGVITIDRGPRRTDVTYRIVRLPLDERVRDRVLHLEVVLVTALRSIDGTVQVQLTGGPLRESDPGPGRADPSPSTQELP